jgi:hypothetical protein
LFWDIALNATIPAALYLVAKHLIAASELSALLWATAFPLLKTAHDLVKRRELDPVALLVLLGLVASVMAVLLRGDPHLLLIRESFVHGGIRACVSGLAAVPAPHDVLFRSLFHGGRR